GRAGCKEREVIEVGRWRDRDKPFDFRSAHQELHADPGAEGEASDPAGPRLRVNGLRPVERGGRIRQFAGAMIESALAAANAAEVEAEHRKAAMREGVVALIDDLVIHRAVELWVRMQDHRDRRVLLLSRVVTA